MLFWIFIFTCQQILFVVGKLQTMAGLSGDLTDATMAAELEPDMTVEFVPDTTTGDPMNSPDS